MKQCKKLLSVLLCAVLVFGLTTTALAADSYSAWFEPNYKEMLELDLIPDSFSGLNLKKDITRGEMCELAVLALEDITDYTIEPERTDYFSDTQELYILKAYELGIVSGYPDGTFLPNDALSRQEFFQIVENFCNAAACILNPGDEDLSRFADTGKISSWAVDAATVCVRYGFVNGDSSSGALALKPKDNASRQEAMAMFLRAYKSLNEYYFYIKNAQVVVDDNSVSEGSGIVGEDAVVDDVAITGVSMQMMVNSDGLNIRSSWSKDSDILGVVPYGTELNVTGICENGWVRIDYKGKTGYVNGDYVSEYEEVDHSANATAVEIAEYAMQFIGYPYIYGAESPSSGFDCSGLVYYVYGQYGYNLYRVADDQMDYNGTAVSRDNLQVGDLVFFGSGSYADHVGIYIGNNNFVHAANPSSGVRISSMNETYYATRYLCARRIVLN